MNANEKLEVSITQCKVCGTLSIHWGRVVAGACSSCAEATERLHESYLNADDYRHELNQAIEDWAKNPSSDLDFLDNLETLLEHDDSHDDDHPIFGSREWSELNLVVPLLNSIANTIMDSVEALEPLVEGVNVLLASPEDHWRFFQELELYKEQIETKVARINESILEAQTLGFDVPDYESGLLSALANTPEFWFEGKDDIGEGKTACFFYDGSDNCFNSFTFLGEPSHYRRHFNTP